MVLVEFTACVIHACTAVHTILMLALYSDIAPHWRPVELSCPLYVQVFGCDMRKEYPATLFRFPLRTPAQALTSQISKQVR